MLLRSRRLGWVRTASSIVSIFALDPGTAPAQSAVQASSAYNIPGTPPPIQITHDLKLDPVASVWVSGPAGAIQVTRERRYSNEPVVVVTPLQSAPPVGLSITNTQPVTTFVLAMYSAAPPFAVRPDAVAEPNVVITPTPR